MITDDQRREVAARIRELMSECCFLPMFMVIAQAINDCLPEEEGFYALILADLIERPTARDVADFDHESFKCARCGYRVLSISGNPDHAKLVAPEGGVIDFGYCPNCGAEVVDEDGAN